MQEKRPFRLLAQLYLHQEQLERCDTMMLHRLLFSKEQQQTYRQQAVQMQNEYLRRQMNSLLQLIEEVERCCLKNTF